MLKGCGGRGILRAMKRRIGSGRWGWLALLMATATGCDALQSWWYGDAVGVSPSVAPPDEPEAPQRERRAAVWVHFVAGRQEPGEERHGEDRLRAAAVFADIDRRDTDFVGDLVGLPPSRTLPAQADSCLRVAEPLDAPPPRRPHAWVQLLDIGNVELRAGTMRLPMRVQLLPNLVEGARGVRYDLDVDRSRSFLGQGLLELRTTGGDGVGPLVGRVQVPRPVRIAQVGGQLVRGGTVELARDAPLRELDVRWGSVDGTADLELRIGSEQPGAVGWLRCRLRDDGEFRVPGGLLAELPARSAERPWLLTILRSRKVALDGFAGQPWIVALSDATRIR